MNQNQNGTHRPLWLTVLCNFTALLVILSLTFGPAFASESVTITVNPAQASEWSVSENVLGKFIEHNGRDIYPGFYSQHLANSSFEMWSIEQRGTRNELFRAQEGKDAGLAMGWQIRSPQAIQCFRHTGGVHGKWYQRIVETDDRSDGGISQYVVIPDERTLEYDLRFYARSPYQSGTIAVLMEEEDGEVLFREEVTLDRSWKKHRVSIGLDRMSRSRFQESPFGEYRLVFLVPKSTVVDVDWTMLMSGDAVKGKYNPTTLHRLKKFHVPTLRWPGGNFASTYDWRDGVGPLKKRPVGYNLPWGGMEPNFFGTNEFLEFCALAGVEPYLNVGHNVAMIPPEVAGDWVEYVNGDTTTPMGKLRAEHGYPDPWGVKNWQVGNESYGSYQYGYVGAEIYAEQYRQYYRAMKRADLSITVYAAGADPYYVNWDGRGWNQTLFQIAGKDVEGIDIHRYARIPGADLYRDSDWWTPERAVQMLLCFPSQFEEIIGMVRQDARSAGIHNVRINVGEWNLSGRSLPDRYEFSYPAMVHAAYMASTYNTFLRQGDVVRFGHQRENVFYFRPFDGDFYPVHPGAYITRMYAEPFQNGVEYHHLPVKVASPAFSHPRVYGRIRAMEDAPLVDAAAIIESNRERIVLFVINRNFQEGYSPEIHWEGALDEVGDIAGKIQYASDPFARQERWDGPETFTIDKLTFRRSEDGDIQFDMPPASVARVIYQRF